MSNPSRKRNIVTLKNSILTNPFGVSVMICGNVKVRSELKHEQAHFWQATSIDEYIAEP